MLDLKKFNLTLTKKKELTNDDTKVREILELCSNKSITLTDEILNSINCRQLLLVYQEIYVKPLLDKEILKDMVNGQYLMENLSYIKQSYIDDEEEIY